MCGFYNVLTMWQHEAGITTFVPIQSSTVGVVAKKRQEIDPRRMVIITRSAHRTTTVCIAGVRSVLYTGYH